MTANKFPILVIVFIIAGCSTNPSKEVSSQLIITNFQQGKMKEENGEWLIYEHGSELEFNENGKCISNNEEITCMWHGFRFEYTSTDPIATMSCKVKLGGKQRLVNPDEVVSESTDVFEFNLELPQDEREFVNPQYISTPDQPRNDFFASYKCFYKNNIVLEFDQKVWFSKQDEI